MDMKTIGCIAVSLLLTASSAGGQLVRSYGITVGPVVADQRYEYSPLSQFAPDPIYPDKLLWGVDAGAFVEFFTLPHFSVVAGLNYSQKGRIVTVIETAIDHTSPQGYVDLGPRDVTLRFHYISVPVLAKMRFETPAITPFLAAGPRFEYLVAYPSSPAYDQFKKVGVALSISAGLELSTGFSPKLLLEGTYLPSISNAYQNEIVTVTSRAAAITVGVAF